MYSLWAIFNSVKLASPLKAPGVIKDMLLWLIERDLRDGRVPNALSARNLMLFLSKLIEYASQGNSLGICARPALSQRMAQLFSLVQIQLAGQERTQAHTECTGQMQSKTGKKGPHHYVQGKKKKREISKL